MRPLVKGLLEPASITGPTAPLWVGVAEMTDYYDKANCAYYDTCDLAGPAGRRGAADQPHLQPRRSRIRAQEMTAAELDVGRARSLLSQDAYFHGVVADPGPVANDCNTDLEVVVFNSSTDYQTYAGAHVRHRHQQRRHVPGGQPGGRRQPGPVHRLRGGVAAPDVRRSGTSTTSTPTTSTAGSTCTATSAPDITTPTIWWIEGFAEYVSYSYRNVDLHRRDHRGGASAPTR